MIRPCVGLKEEELKKISKHLEKFLCVYTTCHSFIRKPKLCGVEWSVEENTFMCCDRESFFVAVIVCERVSFSEIIHPLIYISTCSHIGKQETSVKLAV